MNAKKPLILHILNYLTAYTSKDWPLTQTEIACEISEFCPCDRKTVGRCIKILCEMKYPIVKTPKGYYMARQFSISEITFVWEAILAAPGIDEAEKKVLAERVRKALTKIIKR